MGKFFSVRPFFIGKNHTAGKTDTFICLNNSFGKTLFAALTSRIYNATLSGIAAIKSIGEIKCPFSKHTISEESIRRS